MNNIPEDIQHKIKQLNSYIYEANTLRTEIELWLDENYNIGYNTGIKHHIFDIDLCCDYGMNISQLQKYINNKT